MAEAMTTLGGGEEPEEDEEETGEEGQEEPESSKKSGGGRKLDLASSEEKPQGFRDGFKKGWNSARSKAGKGAKKAGKEVAKKAGEQAAKQAVQKGAQAAASKGIGAALGTAVGGPLGTVLGTALASLLTRLITDKRIHLIIICLILILLIIIWVPAGGVALSYMDGGLTGGTPKVETDLNNPEHQQTIKSISDLTNESGACGKRLEFGDPKDIELIKSGEIDYRVLVAIKTLAQENTHLKISHVAHLLSSIPANTIETHSNIEESYLDNVSAHKDGMAFDIVEIGCVYEKCACSDKCGCKQIPVQVAWQNLGGITSIAETAGLGKVSELLGLPQGSLGGIDANEMFKNTGLASLAQDLKMSFENIKNVTSLNSLMDKFGQSEIEKTLSLPTGSLKDQNSLSAYVTTIGQQRMEDVLSLPSESLAGSSASQVFKSSGQKSIEGELNLPANLISSDPTKALELLKNQQFTKEQKIYIEKTIGWPSGTINDLMTGLKNGDKSAISSTLVSAGKDVLEQTFGLPKGEFDTPGPAPVSSAESKIVDQKYNLPEGTFKSMIEDLKNGQNLNPLMTDIGAPELEAGLNLVEGGVKQIMAGKKTVDAVLQESRQIYGGYDTYLASRLNILSAEATTLQKQILNGQSISSISQKIGINKFETGFGLKAGTLTSLINGTLSPESFLSQNNKILSDMANSLGMAKDTINAMFSGNFAQGMIDYGQYQIAQVFGFSVSDLNSFIQSMDISGLIQNQAVQAISSILGVNANVIGSILTGNIDVTSLISMGVSILYGGGFGSIFAGVFGGVFGGTCTTLCYKPTAIINIRQVLGQALDLYKIDPSMKPAQIITYRQADVDYFSEKINSLYGEDRQPNYGLFTRPETKAHIHIGY